MSIDNIQLPSIVIQNLYQNTLVSNAGIQPPPFSKEASIRFLGGNNNRIIILVSNPEVTYLSDTQLNFLTGILNACKLNLDDVAVINFYHYPAIDHKKLSSEFDAKILLLLGVSPGELDLPFTIPEFQIQSFNNQKYMSAPSLDVLQNDVELKKKLWASLKQIFLQQS